MLERTASPSAALAQWYGMCCLGLDPPCCLGRASSGAQGWHHLDRALYGLWGVSAGPGVQSGVLVSGGSCLHPDLLLRVVNVCPSITQHHRAIERLQLVILTPVALAVFGGRNTNVPGNWWWFFFFSLRNKSVSTSAVLLLGTAPGKLCLQEVMQGLDPAAPCCCTHLRAGSSGAVQCCSHCWEPSALSCCESLPGQAR